MITISEYKNIEDHFNKFQQLDEPWKEFNKMMLTLVSHLKRQFEYNSVFAGIGHLDLVLSKDLEGNHRIIISPQPGQYRISYTLPDNISPWPDAEVVGYTSDVIQASEMILSALDNRVYPDL